MKRKTLLFKEFIYFICEWGNRDNFWKLLGAVRNIRHAPHRIEINCLHRCTSKPYPSSKFTQGWQRLAH